MLLNVVCCLGMTAAVAAGNLAFGRSFATLQAASQVLCEFLCVTERRFPAHG